MCDILGELPSNASSELIPQTLAPQTPPPAGVEESLTAMWKSAGGDVSEETLAPAGLWLTAILECAQFLFKERC